MEVIYSSDFAVRRIGRMRDRVGVGKEGPCFEEKREDDDGHQPRSGL
jgi:hypothetical protein